MAPINIFKSFAGPLNQDTGAGKLTNCRVILRAQEEQKPAQVYLMGSPGLTQVCKPASSPCIALCHALGTVWSAHANGQIYSGVETAAPALQGTVAVGAVPVIRLAEDRTALAIASNGNALGGIRAGTGYTATLSGVVNAGFDASINFDPAAVCELDNTTIWAGASNAYANQSDKMYSSTPLAPGTVSPTSFATAEARADPVLDVVTIGRTFWPFGSRSVEQWYDQGGTADFPFTPFTNSLLDVGLASRRTLATLHDKIMWVGNDRRVWLGKGQSGAAISPAWVDLMLQQIDLSQLTAYMYGQGGDEFYVLTFEGLWSIELALSSMGWVFRQTKGRLDHAGRCAVEHDAGVTFVGLITGEVCKVDLTTASEPAGVLTRTIISMWLGLQESYHTLDTLDVTSYMGPAAGTFALDWSQDGLQTFKGLRTITLPQPGTRRAIARGMGSSRRRQIRLTYAGTTAPFQIDEMLAGVTNGM